ncbi:MAG TPA: patatin-like phospholipase family protein [Solirubrobacteraceae bacterium]
MAKPSIGVCLSGGGFRASFYGLGVLRYLAEANLLGSVVAISAVSGGSIAAAAVADSAGELAAGAFSLDAFLASVDRPFRDAVTRGNIRNKWLARAAAARLGGDNSGRGAALGRVMAEELYSHDLVRELPPGPQIVLTTTDLATGRAFRIARDFIGSYDFGYVQPAPGEIELGFAVAASAAVPGMFPPAWLSTNSIALKNAPAVLSLLDGGVYDNLGLEWFQGWSSGRPEGAVKPDFLIVVNASGLLKTVTKPYGEVRAVWRSKSVQYAQTTRLRTRWFVGDLLAEREQGVYLGIGLDPRKYKLANNKPVHPDVYRDALPSVLVEPAAEVRTDLDRFSSTEADLLSYHGYQSLHARLAALYPKLAIEQPAWRQFADLSTAEISELRAELERGAKRLRPPRLPAKRLRKLKFW